MSSPRGLVVGGIGGMSWGVEFVPVGVEVPVVVGVVIPPSNLSFSPSEPTSSSPTFIPPTHLPHPTIHLPNPPAPPPDRRILRCILIDLNCRFACGTYLLA